MGLVMLEKNGIRIRVAAEAVAEHVALGWSTDVNFKLTEVQWDDLRFPAAGINPPGAASDPTRDTSDGRLAFSPTADNLIAVQVQMPHAWLEGSSISPHIHWSPTTTHTGNVKWQLQYKIAEIGSAFPGSWTTDTALQAASGVADTHQLVEFADIPMTGLHLSCMLLMIISRLGADGADTYTGDAKLNEFDIHFQADALGSNEEYYK